MEIALNEAALSLSAYNTVCLNWGKLTCPIIITIVIIIIIIEQQTFFVLHDAIYSVSTYGGQQQKIV